MTVELINERTQEPVATAVEIVMTRRERRKGLLGRESMNAGGAMVISPCFAVHTAFMRFSIDVAFVDHTGRAVRIVRDLRPWRMAASARAYAVIEFPAGRLEACGVEVGDRLYLSC